MTITPAPVLLSTVAPGSTFSTADGTVYQLCQIGGGVTVSPSGLPVSRASDGLFTILNDQPVTVYPSAKLTLFV